MAVTTCLTWMQEKHLKTYFGEEQFSLLYKASVHGFSKEKLLDRCSHQGSILTVIYNEYHILGAYMPGGYLGELDISITLFAFQETEISKCEIGPLNPCLLFSGNNINSEFIINLEKKAVVTSVTTMEKLGLPQCCMSFKECEVFRCEDLLDKRSMDGIIELKESLMSAIRTYKPYGGLVHQIQILLLGPIGAGKSSFFNAVKSVFRGHVTNQALVGSDITGVSEKYRRYVVKDGKDGDPLPFILCDLPGLSEKEGRLCLDDILSVLKGHVADRYQFNSMNPVKPGHGDYICYPLLKDRIHCVAFVFSAYSVHCLSDEMVEKIKRIRKELIKCGMVQVVLLTHVDTLDLITKGDLIDIYKCVPVKLKLEELHREFGFPLSDIFVVSNYSSEWELEPVKDVLILSALRQMLWAADDFLEDLPLEETNRGV